MQRYNIPQWRRQAMPLAAITAMLAVPIASSKSQDLTISKLALATVSGTVNGSAAAANAEAQRQAIRQTRAEWLRAQLAARGFNSQATQDDVVNFVNEQEQATLGLRTAGDELGAALRNNASTDAQVRALLDTFLAAVAQARSLQKTAEQKLDAQIAYTQTPRLEALLRLLGVLGEERAFALNFAIGSSNAASPTASAPNTENHQTPGGQSSASNAGPNANAESNVPQKGGPATADAPATTLVQTRLKHFS